MDDLVEAGIIWTYFLRLLFDIGATQLSCMCQSMMNHPGVVSIQRCYLASIENPSMMIRRSQDRPIFYMNPHIWKDGLHIETGPWSPSTHTMPIMFQLYLTNSFDDIKQISITFLHVFLRRIKQIIIDRNEYATAQLLSYHGRFIVANRNGDSQKTRLQRISVWV